MRLIPALVLALFTFVVAYAEDRPSLFRRSPRQPAQPKDGPGGADYTYAKVRATKYGEKGGEYWLYEPDDAQTKKLPLVVFLHGYSAMSPLPYRGWIDHIVRTGAIVIYPRYQEHLLTLSTEYHPNTVKAVRTALELLAEPGHFTPDLDRVAVVGHSAGGVGAATFAARAKDDVLPIPKAVMIVEPGQGLSDKLALIPLDDYSKIPAETRLFVVIGDADKFVGDISARRIWARTSHVKDRAFITVQSDHHGSPELHASHFSPLADFFTTDALDWFGYWRMFDTLSASAFAGNDTRLDPAMGQWSDGTDVKPLKIER
jgi:pimeloyl-ACP methyl ester carboxylesterase